MDIEEKKNKAAAAEEAVTNVTKKANPGMKIVDQKFSKKKLIFWKLIKV